MIDVGTTKVCTVLGRKDGNKGVEVLAYSTVPCSGLRKGNITDITATETAVGQSVGEVERSSGYSIKSAFVGVTGSHVTFENRREKLELEGERGPITADEINRSLGSADASKTESGRKLIHAIRMSYSVDGEDGIRNPTGMHSRNLEVETHLVTGGLAFIGKLVKAVENAGIDVTGLVLEPLASGLAVLTPEEKNNGAVLVDIGGGTTDVVIFKGGRICYSGVIPVGGYQFTNDIAVTFNTTFEAAEAAKLEYAGTELMASSIDEEIPLPVVGQDVDLKVKQLDITQLTRERAQELARLVMLKLEDAAAKDSVATRLVITGGASALPGLTDLMERKLTIPARQGLPSVRGDIPEELNEPAYSTVLGMLLWAVMEYVPSATEPDVESNAGKEEVRARLLAGFLGRLSRLVPAGLFAAKR